MKTLKQEHLKDTLEDLKAALAEWDKIPDRGESELDQFRKKTQELLLKLSEQIKALDL